MHSTIPKRPKKSLRHLRANPPPFADAQVLRVCHGFQLPRFEKQMIDMNMARTLLSDELNAMYSEQTRQESAIEGMKDQNPLLLQDSRRLGDGLAWMLHMFQEVEHENDVKTAIGFS